MNRAKTLVVFATLAVLGAILIAMAALPRRDVGDAAPASAPMPPPLPASGTASPGAAVVPATAAAGTRSKQFIDDALQSGLTEVAMARLAQGQGVYRDLKMLASAVERSHSVLNTRLQQMGAAPRTDAPDGGSPEVGQSVPATAASQLNQQDEAPLPAAATNDQAQVNSELADLQLLSGDAFDRAYLKLLAARHADAIARYDAASMDAALDAPARAWAGDAATELRTLAAMIESIRATMPD